jgi:putative two-component system response regulator
MNATDRKCVLIVDDSPENISIATNVLRDTYRTKVATNGFRALLLAEGDDKPDVILLDIVMPEMDGYEVCRRLKANPATESIPVIFLTTQSSVEEEMRGFDTGAIDYIHKPFSPPIMRARVRAHLLVKEARDFLRDQNDILEQKVQQRTHELSTIQDVTIAAMASLAETRDNETGNHIRRTQHYLKALAVELKDHPRFRDVLTADVIELLFKSAPLHDIGKVGIPDAILLKPGRLTVDEFEIMKRHTTLGRDAIEAAEAGLDFEVEFLRYAKEIAYAHQEKWDGSGYPLGIGGDDIPVSARLMALADVYDALISRRVYKEPMPHAEAVEIITSGAGRHFDPDIVDAFLNIAHEFYAISQRFADSEHEIRLKAGL